MIVGQLHRHQHLLVEVGTPRRRQVRPRRPPHALKPAPARAELQARLARSGAVVGLKVAETNHDHLTRCGVGVGGWGRQGQGA
jgi:hypothetical protein